MEYYAYCELRDFAKDDWTEIDQKYEKQCKFLYTKYERLHEEEIRREEHSKSAKVAKKLETLKEKPDYSDTVLLKKLQKKKGKK
jgi:lipocalin